MKHSTVISRLSIPSATMVLGVFSILTLATTSVFGQTPPPAKVEVVQATIEELADTTEIPGIIDFNTSSQITSEQAGIISEIYFDEGDMVKSGQLIAKLNTDLLKQDIKVKNSELEALKAEQGRIEKDMARSQKLLKTSFESKRALETLEFNLQANKANRQKLLNQIERLNILIRKSTIKAQYDGLILAKHKQPGEWLGQADPIVTLAKLDETIALVSVPERYVRYIKLGNKTAVNIAPLDLQIEGILNSTVPVADLRTKSVPVKVTIDYQSGLVRNMSLKVSIATSEPRTAVTFPRDALIQHQGKEFIYAVKTNDDNSKQAQIIPVTITGRYGAKVSVQPGLISETTQIIVKGNDRLRPDQPIIIQ
ncbi:efflux RND transporter periplasmic adaptor subunit [Litoribacillus peritrichatus]|uniref:Efflux RND transporter periplasmic adaptor subunit n=1 Tax=Litoribacillus peritrichatus TaxID=718191 RepID=A0ABP7M565_9GAMM